jgi:hypothetical protein
MHQSLIARVTPGHITVSSLKRLQVYSSLPSEHFSRFAELTNYMERSPSWKDNDNSSVCKKRLVFTAPEGSLLCSQKPCNETRIMSHTSASHVTYYKGHITITKTRATGLTAVRSLC